MRRAAGTAVRRSARAMVIAVLHGLMSMTCVGCGFEILADFAFCPRCGRSTAGCLRELRLCLRAGLRLLVRAADRPAKSAAVAKPRVPQADADRRQVTVVFADLCEFTALSERLDPEEVTKPSRARCSTRSARPSPATVALSPGTWAMPCSRCLAHRSPMGTIPNGRSRRPPG